MCQRSGGGRGGRGAGGAGVGGGRGGRGMWGSAKLVQGTFSVSDMTHRGQSALNIQQK